MHRDQLDPFCSDLKRDILNVFFISPYQTKYSVGQKRYVMQVFTVTVMLDLLDVALGAAAQGAQSSAPTLRTISKNHPITLQDVASRKGTAGFWLYSGPLTDHHVLMTNSCARACDRYRGRRSSFPEERASNLFGKRKLGKGKKGEK